MPSACSASHGRERCQRRNAERKEQVESTDLQPETAWPVKYKENSVGTPTQTTPRLRPQASGLRLDSGLKFVYSPINQGRLLSLPGASANQLNRSNRMSMTRITHVQFVRILNTNNIQYYFKPMQTSLLFHFGDTTRDSNKGPPLLNPFRVKGVER